MYTLPKIERFQQNVASKYTIYNSVFITLPFDSIDNTGVLLPLFTDICENSIFNNILNLNYIIDETIPLEV